MDKHRKILIVEDESITAMALEYYLMDQGYEVLESQSTGEEAVLAAKAGQPDIVLMDIHLGGPMDGIEAAALMDADRPIFVIFITGYSNRSIVDRALALNPSGCLFKPIDFDQLDAILAAIGEGPS